MVNLHSALRLKPAQAVAFVGAGGKSAAIAQLVKELEGDFPVVVTTTTHLGVNQQDWTQHHIIGYSKNIPQIISALENRESMLVSGSLNAAGDRWTALDPAALEELWGRVAAHKGIMLIEADGARRRWIKAPAEHEPVIPAFAHWVVPVVGIHAWEQPLDEKIAHRPELLAERLEIDLGDPIGDEQLVRWATSPKLALKGVPAAARVRILINQVDTQQRREAARRIAVRATHQADLDGLVLANIGREPQWLERIGRVAGIVLAAGGSSRADGQKLMYVWRGKPLIRHVVEQGLLAGLDPMVVVLGEDADSIRDALAGLPLILANNPNWQQGQSTSLQVGLSSIEAPIEGALFLLGDMPLVSAELIHKVVHAHQRSLSPIVAPWAEERWGNPALFDRVTFDDLLGLEGDFGGRRLYDRYAILSVPAGREALFDCDTDEDLEWLITHYP